MVEIKKYYDEKQLEDFDGEVWVDVPEYVGIYMVSNYGRVKSLYRQVQGRGDIIIDVEEKILGQTKQLRHGRIEALKVKIGKKTLSVPKVVFMSHYPDVKIGKGECIMHKNKVLWDNRITNLGKVTRKKSSQTDQLYSIFAQKAVKRNMAKAVEANIKAYSELTHKVCSKCGYVGLKEEFDRKKSICHACDREYHNKRKRDYKPTGKLKVCIVCGDEKEDYDFPKLRNICKKCTNIKHNDYFDQHRQGLTDTYARACLSKKGISNPTDKQIEQFRKEQLEKRKPRFFVDGLEFVKLMDFSTYIEKEYGIPFRTVSKRVFKGYTEEECKLPVNATKNLPLYRLRITNLVTGEVDEYDGIKSTEMINKYGSIDVRRAIKNGGYIRRITKRSKFKHPLKLEII